jgi:hypothetical protein
MPQAPRFRSVMSLLLVLLIPLSAKLEALGASFHAIQTEPTASLNFLPQIATEKVSGTIVAYDVGRELANAECRQNLIVRTNTRRAGRITSKYLIVRYESPCLKLIPDKTLQRGPSKQFVLTRSPECDQQFADLLYFKQRSPTGFVSQTRLLKRSQGHKSEKIPAHETLPCYQLSAWPER